MEIERFHAVFVFNVYSDSGILDESGIVSVSSDI